MSYDNAETIIYSMDSPWVSADHAVSDDGDRGRDPEPLSNAEQAFRRDSERLARIEAVLDDPSLAVPLDELD